MSYCVIKRISPLPPYIDEIYTTSHIDEVLSRADFILALPQTKKFHMFDKEEYDYERCYACPIIAVLSSSDLKRCFKRVDIFMVQQSML